MECFGSPLSDYQNESFYLPIDTADSMLFGGFVIGFAAPMLTTSSLSSAVLSAGNGNGYVVELRAVDSRLTAFDLSPFSKFLHKKEVLFCGGAFPLRISNIVHVATHSNYGQFVSALSMLDIVLRGERPDEKPSDLDLKLMIDILQRNLDGFCVYIRNLFEFFVIFVRRICAHCYWIGEYFKPIIGILVDEHIENMVLIEKVVTVFENVECLDVDGGPNGIVADEGYLKALLERMRALDGKQCALKRIELKNAHFDEELVFDQMMESFFEVGFDVNIQRTDFDRSLVFEAVEQ